MENRRGKSENSVRFYFLGSKITTVTAAMKLKDVCSLEGKLWQTSVSQFNHPVVSNSLRPHEPQHARLPCSSPTPGVHPNPCPSSRLCHPTISSSVVHFFSCLQSFPASGGSFLMSKFFLSGSQSIVVSASVSVLPVISFRVDWLDLLVVQDSQESSPTSQFKYINITLTYMHGYWKDNSFD